MGKHLEGSGRDLVHDPIPNLGTDNSPVEIRTDSPHPPTLSPQDPF